MNVGPEIVSNLLQLPLLDEESRAPLLPICMFLNSLAELQDRLWLVTDQNISMNDKLLPGASKSQSSRARPTDGYHQKSQISQFSRTIQQLSHPLVRALLSVSCFPHTQVFLMTSSSPEERWHRKNPLISRYWLISDNHPRPREADPGGL